VTRGHAYILFNHLNPFIFSLWEYIVTYARVMAFKLGLFVAGVEGVHSTHAHMLDASVSIAGPWRTGQICDRAVTLEKITLLFNVTSLVFIFSI
jgi:hypothetical protein